MYWLVCTINSNKSFIERSSERINQVNRLSRTITSKTRQTNQPTNQQAKKPNRLKKSQQINLRTIEQIRPVRERTTHLPTATEPTNQLMGNQINRSIDKPINQSTQADQVNQSTHGCYLMGDKIKRNQISQPSPSSPPFPPPPPFPHGITLALILNSF